MPTTTLALDVRAKVAEQLELVQLGPDRYRIDTPLLFDDGDEYAIVLKRDGGRWILTDEAHTYMRLSFDLEEEELLSGPRYDIIARALSMYDVEDRDGELILPVTEDNVGSAIFAFAQAVSRIYDVRWMLCEPVNSTLGHDVRELVCGVVPYERLEQAWHDGERDPEGMYAVDYRINGLERPLFIQALSDDAQTQQATIALHVFNAWEIPYEAVGVFEDMERIDRQVRERYSAVCQRQFSTLEPYREKFVAFLEEVVGG